MFRPNFLVYCWCSGHATKQKLSSRNSRALFVVIVLEVEVEELECIDVLDVECVDERLIEVQYDECQGILCVHCVAERLADVEDRDCMQVDDVECICNLSLGVQCWQYEVEHVETYVEHSNDEV